ncbi:MAG: hypothetical protein ACREUO_07710, partial [Burkholderiales bacterium]
MLIQIPGVLDAGELDSLRRTLGEGRFDDGAATAGAVAREVKRNLQLDRDSDAARRSVPVVLAALRRNPVFFSAALPHRVHGPLFSRYDPGMEYGDHFDNAVMGAPDTVRTDIAVTVFLNAPEEYGGGELLVQD